METINNFLHSNKFGNHSSLSLLQRGDLLTDCVKGHDKKHMHLG